MVIVNLQGRTFAGTSKADNVLQHIFRKQSQIALSAKPAQHRLAVRKIKDLKRASSKSRRSCHLIKTLCNLTMIYKSTTLITASLYTFRLGCRMPPSLAALWYGRAE